MYSLIVALAGAGLLAGGLWGMRFGLQDIFSGKIRMLFWRLTLTPWRGFAVGVLSAAALQSSTAVALITIGLTGAGCLSFQQSLGVILGANIGTCTTVQLLTLPALPGLLIPLLGGCLAVMLVRRFRRPAMAAAGFVSMFLGLELLSEAVSGLSRADAIIPYLIAAKDNPVYGITGGILLTSLFQSSSAATGVLMALGNNGLLDINAGAYIVYGNNIGSCISSVIVGAAAPLAAKRTAIAHIVLNIAGVLCFLPATHWLTALAVWLTGDFAEQIVLIHTVFNVASSLAVMPFIRQYAQLIVLLAPDRMGNRR